MRPSSIFTFHTVGAAAPLPHELANSFALPTRHYQSHGCRTYFARKKTTPQPNPSWARLAPPQPLNHNTGFSTKNEASFAASFSYHDDFLMTLRVTHGKHVLRRTNFRQSPQNPKQREYIFNTETQNEM